MQSTGVQGAEEKTPGTRRCAAYIGMNTAIPADMGQNNPMTYLHAVHVPGQRNDEDMVYSENRVFNIEYYSYLRYYGIKLLINDSIALAMMSFCVIRG